MSPLCRLTEQTIKALAVPAFGNRITYDAEVKGFGIRITTAGARSFVLNYRAHGRERRITIGSYPDWTVAAAREQAKTLKRQVDVGEDPMGARHAEREAPTIDTLAQRYLAEHAPRKRARSVKEDVSLLRQLILPKLGKLRVAAVRRGDIEAFHRNISKDTPVRANRALALLGKMFSLAVAWELRADSPCRGIERNQEDKRERYLTSAELARLMAALAAHPNQSRANGIRLLLLTGARAGELFAATWDQFDLTGGVWTKPASMTKQNKIHRVPLSTPARQLLTEMRATTNGDELFPGRRNKFRRPDLDHFWESICKAADVSGVRMHDLRHSYASFLVGAGLSLPVVGALLGHSSPATTQRYAHLADDPLRDATERVGRIVADAGRGGDAVVALPTTRRA